MTRLTIRIDFDDGEGFGPGKARLLELVDEKGSIRSAAAAMDMSYRRAWLLLEDVGKTFGAPVIATATGGVKGGGATLTEFGRQIVTRYRTIERAAARATAGELSALTGAMEGTPTPARTDKHPRRRLLAKPEKG